MAFIIIFVCAIVFTIVIVSSIKAKAAAEEAERQAKAAAEEATRIATEKYNSLAGNIKTFNDEYEKLQNQYISEVVSLFWTQKG